MAILQQRNEDTFVKEFQGYQANKFSIEGLRALYQWLLDISNDTETNINLDVIAICVEYDEYETLQEVLKYYNLKTRQELEDRTVVIDIPNSKALIVCAF